MKQWPKIAVLVWDSRGEDLGRQVGDVGWDGVASEELGHLIGERVAVVFKQSVSVASVAQTTKWAFFYLVNITWVFKLFTTKQQNNFFCDGR